MSSCFPSCRNEESLDKWVEGGDSSRKAEVPCSWRMGTNFADSRAINQSGLAIWCDRVSTSWAAATHIRYALRLARSKLESQLTLLIALSNLIWETMGDWRRCFIKDGSSHNILFLLRFGGPPLAALFLLQLAHRLPWLSAYNYFSIKALICSVLYTASWHDRKNEDETVNLFPFCLALMGVRERLCLQRGPSGTDTSSARKLMKAQLGFSTGFKVGISWNFQVWVCSGIWIMLIRGCSSVVA